ncbi:hypothetical protein DFH09DRAFT_1100441 [Mycena vulgaris]|nr:hypothetical protein DFH09DRAFT_1100441 [Mycena vulgaris]
MSNSNVWLLLALSSRPTSPASDGTFGLWKVAREDMEEEAKSKRRLFVCTGKIRMESRSTTLYTSVGIKQAGGRSSGLAIIGGTNAGGLAGCLYFHYGGEQTWIMSIFVPRTTSLQPESQRVKLQTTQNNQPNSGLRSGRKDLGKGVPLD